MTAIDPDDATLLTAVAAGEAAATESLIRRYAPLVVRACRRQLAGTDADDAAQAVFLVLWRRSSERAVAANLPGWLVVTASHICATARRAAARRQRHEREVAMAGARAGDGAEGEALALLDEALAALPSAERDLVVRRHLLDQAPAAVATSTGCPIGTVHSRTSRALERLRAWYERRGIACTSAVLAALLAAESQAMESTAPPPSSPSAQAIHLARALPFVTRPIAVATGVVIVLAAILGTIIAIAPAAVVPPPPPVERVARCYGIGTYLWHQQTVHTYGGTAVGRPATPAAPQTPSPEDIAVIAQAASWRDLQSALLQVLQRRDPGSSIDIVQPGIPEADLLGMGVRPTDLDGIIRTIANGPRSRIPGLDGSRVLLVQATREGQDYVDACMDEVHAQRRQAVLALLGDDGLADAKALADGLRSVVDVTAPGLGIAPRSTWPVNVGPSHLAVTWIPEERTAGRPMAAARSHGGSLIATFPHAEVLWLPDERATAVAEELRRRLDSGPAGRLFMDPQVDTAPTWVVEGEWSSAAAEARRRQPPVPPATPDAPPTAPGF